MKTRCSCAVLFLLLPSLANLCHAQAPAPFIYQGRLTEAGNPSTGTYEMQFKLFDTPDAGTGTQQGNTISNAAVVASNGVFTVTLDFATTAFDGSPRFLEIGVKVAGSVNPLSTLAPRQAIAPLPYAVHSLSASQLNGVPASSFVQASGSGNVGLGTAAPQARLHLYHQPDSLSQLIETGGGTNAWTKLGFKNLNGQWDIGTSRGFNNDVFYLDRAGNSSLEFQFSTSGRLGLGLEPQAKLHLYDPGSVTHLIESGGGLNAWAKVSFRNAHGQWDIGTSRGFNGDQFYISRPGAPIIAFGVEPNGDAAVGRNLSVSGSTTVSGDTSVSRNVRIGPVFAPAARLHVVSDTQPAIQAESTGPNTPAVYASGRPTQGIGRAIHAEGHATQERAAGGFVKAMAVVQGPSILRCFSAVGSPLFPPALDASPCGIQLTETSRDSVKEITFIDFGFRVDDRFIVVTPGRTATHQTVANIEYGPNGNPREIVVFASYANGDRIEGEAIPFTVVVY